ncbi:MAG: hypothetical protein GY769_06725 [bacterium]|nr:hypothetical protein [bacterium]
MDEVLKLETNAEEAARLQAGIAQMMTEMRRLREERLRDQAEIEESQAETREMLGTIAETLAELKAS